jgi:hypothetical protein
LSGILFISQKNRGQEELLNITEDREAHRYKGREKRMIKALEELGVGRNTNPQEYLDVLICRSNFNCKSPLSVPGCKR